MNKEDKKKLDFIRFLTIIAEEYIKAGGSTKIAAGIVAGQNYGVGANILHAAMSRAYELDRGVDEGAWQPIETAPKDGSPILLAYSDGGVVEGKFVDNSKTQRPWSGFMPRSMYPQKAGVKITHWMAMPKFAAFPNAKEPEDSDE